MYKVLDNNERLFQIKFLTGTRKTVLINEKSCREVPDKECDGVLFELCCAVNATEAKGHIVTSVVELCEDGSTPRVAFRNTKEYRAAKQVQDSVSTPTRIERIRAMVDIPINDVLFVDGERDKVAQAIECGFCGITTIEVMTKMYEKYGEKH